jgi:predicted nucleic acid-binding protein
MAVAASVAPAVTIDACVLVGGRLTNLLLHLADSGAFQPIWSDDIHAEWMRTLHAKIGIPLDKIEYRRGEMERAFPTANVRCLPGLVVTIQDLCKTAAQRKDAHVIATAIAAKSMVILTHNTKDFSAAVLNRYGLSKIKPDEFCVDLLASRRAELLEGIRRHRASLKRSPMSQSDYIHYLAEAIFGMPQFAKSLALFQGAL